MSAIRILPNRGGIKLTPQAQQATYRGLQYSPARPPVWPVVFSADREFIGSRRQLAWSTSLDVHQNFPLIEWMIHQHQVYTSQFGVQLKTKDVVYNREWKEWWRENTAASLVDVQRRLSFDDMMLNYAGLQVLFGYSALLKIAGGKMQLFEPWQISRGKGCETDEKTYGVTINKDGMVLDEVGAIDWVAFCSGDDSGSLIHRYLAFRDEVILNGFTSRTADTLFESPLMSILDKCRDTNSSAEYQLMAQKLQGMFTVVRYMKPETKGGADFTMREGSYGTPDVSGGEGQSGAVRAQSQPQMPLAELRSGMILNMEEGEKVDFLTSKTPSPEFIASQQYFTSQILDVLHIPYSFKDSSKANYSSMKADTVRYFNSCQPIINRNAGDWRMAVRHRIRAGVTQDMPMWKGAYTVDNLPFTLVPKAPWILDPAKEIPAKSAMVSAGWDDNEHVCEALTGRNFYDVIDARSEQEAYARNKGVMLDRGNISVKLTGTSESEEGTAQPADKGNASPASPALIEDE